MATKELNLTVKLLTSICVAIGSTFLTQYALAQDQSTTVILPKKSGSELDQARRAEILPQLYTLWRSGDLDKAMRLAEEVLVLERRMFGEMHEIVAWRYRLNSELFMEAERLAEAKAYAQLYLQIASNKIEPDGWRAEEAKRFSGYMEQVSLMPSRERWELMDTARQIDLLQERRNHKGSLKFAEKKVRKIGNMFGDRHLYWIDAVLDVQMMLIDFGRIEGMLSQLNRFRDDIPLLCKTPHPVQAKLHTVMAAYAIANEQLEEARTQYELAISKYEATGTTVLPEYYETINNYAVWLQSLGETQRPLELLEKASAAGSQSMIQIPWKIEVHRSNLCATYLQVANQAIAESEWLTAQKMLNSSNAIAAQLSEKIDYRRREIEQLKKSIDRVIELPNEMRAKFEVANASIQEAIINRNDGDIENAFHQCSEAYLTIRDLFGDDDLLTTRAHVQMADMATDAEIVCEIYQQASEQIVLLLGRNHPDYADLIMYLAGYELPDSATAIEYALAAKSIYAEVYSIDCLQYSQAAALCGRLLMSSDRDSSLQNLQESIQILDGLNVGPTLDRASVLLDLSRWYQREGRNGDALDCTEESVSILRKLPEVSPGELSTYVNELAILYSAMQRREEAAMLYEEALLLERDTADRQDVDYHTFLYNAGDQYRIIGEYDKSIVLLEELLLAFENGNAKLQIGFDGGNSLCNLYRGQMQAHSASLVLSRLESRLDQTDFRTIPHRLVIAMHRARIAIEANKIDDAKLIVQRALMAYDEQTRASSNTASEVVDDSRADIYPLEELLSVARELELWSEAAKLAEFIFVCRQSIPETQPWILANSRCLADELRLYAALSDSQRSKVALANSLAEEPTDNDTILRLKQSRDLLVEVYGERHREVAQRWTEIASNYSEHRELKEALAAYEKALEIRLLLLGEVHPDSASMYRWISVLQRKLGQFEKSLDSIQHAIRLLKSIYGENHYELAEANHSLALLYLDQGSYADALQPAHEATEIFKNQSGEISYDHANMLRTLYAIYDELGDDQRAVDYLIKSHNIIKEIYGQDSLEFAQSTLIGAMVASEYSTTYEFSESLFKTAIEIFDKNHMQQHPDYADAMNGLGNLYFNQQLFQKSADAYQSALTIRQMKWGTDHHLVAQCHSQLGNAFFSMGDLDRASAELTTAYDTRVRQLGSDSFELIKNLFMLAQVNALRGDHQRAQDLLNESLRLEQSRIAEAIAVGSQSALEQTVNYGKDRIAMLLTLASHAPDNQALSQAALAWTLSRKGLVLDVACQLENAQRLRSFDPATVQLLEQIEARNQELADAAIQMDGTMTAVEMEKTRNSVQQQIAQLHEKLSFQLRDDGLAIDATIGSIEPLLKALPKDSAMIEYVISKSMRLEASSTDFAKESIWTEPHLFAFLLIGESEGGCKLVDLGPAEAINASIEEIRDHITRTPRAMRFASEEMREAEYARISKHLYAQILQPLLDGLTSIKQLIVAPDGDLHFVPFAALHRMDQHYVVEDMAVSYLSSGRDLLRKHGRVGNDTIVLADPDYDLVADEHEQVVNANLPKSLGKTNAPMLAIRGASGDDEQDLRSLRWRPLAGARQEASDVELLLNGSQLGPVRSYIGKQAVEEVFKSARFPRIVHIATHGFYVPHDSEALSTGIGGRSGSTLGQLRSDANPLLRSGIVLAGANQPPAITGGGVRLEDGWLTAQEIAGMDFRSTELIVLSACESGLGQSEIGQGVYGLRRAFLVAGAHSLLTSLFEVPDEETRLLMKSFYQSLLAGKDKSTAIREAQLAMIAARRKSENAAHPFYWGSFILMGDVGNRPTN